MREVRGIKTMEQVQVTLPVRRFGETSRRDAWWVQPVAVVAGLGTAIAYTTWAAFQGEYYAHLGYLSPLYSPELFGSSPHAWFGPQPGWWPGFLPFSPAVLILGAPAGFRLTCYYYRGVPDRPIGPRAKRTFYGSTASSTPFSRTRAKNPCVRSSASSAR